MCKFILLIFCLFINKTHHANDGTKQDFNIGKNPCWIYMIHPWTDIFDPKLFMAIFIYGDQFLIMDIVNNVYC